MTEPKKKKMPLHTKILIGMFVGVALGLLLGPNSFLLPQTGVELSGATLVSAPGGGEPVALATGLPRARIVEEREVGGETWLRLGWELTTGDRLRLKSKGVAEVETAKAGTELEGWMADDPLKARRYSLIGQKLIDWTEWIGLLFLQLIKMVVVPLVFFSLVVGVASLGDFRKLGRIGGRTLIYFTATTVASLTIGLILANLIGPGRLVAQEDRELLLASYEASAGSTVERATHAPSMTDQLIGLIPSNPFAALAGGEMLQIIFFALFLGIALTYLPDERSVPVVDLFDRLNDAMIVLVHVAMALAPYGVAALLFKVVGTTGFSVLVALAAYSAVVVVGLLLHLVLVYGSVIRFGARLPFFGFLGAIREPLLVAFSTSSSSATLPVTKEACEQNLRISPSMTSFVLPLGATVNMDGTALYQGVAAIFIAQVYGLGLSVGDQLTIVLSATLASVGAAGVPGAGMITLALVLTAIGVPTEGLALILGVDRLLDMFRTAVNVTGDSTATAFMARLEGEDLRILSEAEDLADPRHGFEGRLEGGPHPVHVEDED